MDVLINNDGVAFETLFFDNEEKEYNIININLTGFFLSYNVYSITARFGKSVVVNTRSKNGLDGQFGYAHYDASKGCYLHQLYELPGL